MSVIADRRGPRAGIRAALAAAALSGIAAALVAGTQPARAGSALHVAVLVPASGDFAVHNQQLFQGAEIATDEINGAGGIAGSTVALQEHPFAPNASPASIVAKARAAGATTVVLPCDVNAEASIAAAGSKAGLVMLEPCDPDPALTYPTLWPVGMGGNEEVARLAGWAEVEGAKSAYILTASGSSYVSQMTTYFKETVPLDHMKLLGESTVPLKGPLPPSLIATLKRLNPLAIFTAIYPPYLQPLIAKIRAAGLITNIYTTDGMDADQELQQYGADLYNVFIGTFGFVGVGTATQNFLTDYHTKFGVAPPGSFPASASRRSRRSSRRCTRRTRSPRPRSTRPSPPASRCRASPSSPSPTRGTGNICR